MVADSCTHSLPKNEFSQDTQLPCRVPKWSLYITYGSHPCAWSQSLATKPCCTYRQVEYPHGLSIIPMGSQTLEPTVSHDTHLPCRVSTWPFYKIHGSHTCASPQSLATKPCCTPPKHLSGSHRDTFTQGLKTSFP